MDKMSKTIMAIGISIAFIAMTALDSPGKYMYYAGIVVLLGGITAGAGYAMWLLGQKKMEERKEQFFHRSQQYNQKGEFVNDLVFIEEGGIRCKEKKMEL